MTRTTELDAQYIAHTYARFDVTFVRGEGALLFDDAGRRYIDMGSGIAVSVLGYANAAWEKAVCEQAHALSHVSNLYYTQPQTELAELLCRRSGMKRAFFGNSGAEANECAIKTARKYSADRHGENVRPVIVSLETASTAARWLRSPPRDRIRSTMISGRSRRALPTCRPTISRLCARCWRRSRCAQ